MVYFFLLEQLELERFLCNIPFPVHTIGTSHYFFTNP